MKIIEGLKQVKDLLRKAEDLKGLVKNNCALSTMDTPKYGTHAEQRDQISRWIQAHSDILKEIANLRVRIQKTNVMTEITMEIAGKAVIKTIAAWVHRRRDLAKEELSMWGGVNDRGIKESIVKTPSGETTEVKIVRFYDPEERNRRWDELSSEPLLIDAKLEIVNAITDLVE
jgi:hypothetical protein